MEVGNYRESDSRDQPPGPETCVGLVTVRMNLEYV